MLCQVFRSPRKTEMYLYVEKAEGLDRVPAALLKRFGEPEAIMLVHLVGERRLARADADEVKMQIASQGYYLQMPPTLAELLRREAE
jgi:uncharacterized protein YcgL (UPF0745 family)